MNERWQKTDGFQAALVSQSRRTVVGRRRWRGLGQSLYPFISQFMESTPKLSQRAGVMAGISIVGDN